MNPGAGGGSGRVEITPAAREDLHQIWEYIAERKPAAADRIVSKLSRAFDLLTTFSGMGDDCADLGRGLRSWPVKPYLVFFRPTGGGIEVIRILHGARDLDASYFE